MATMIVPTSFAPGVTADQVGITKTEVTLRTGYWLPRAIPAPPTDPQVGTAFADGGVRVITVLPDSGSGGSTPDPAPTSGQIWPRA